MTGSTISGLRVRGGYGFLRWRTRLTVQGMTSTRGVPGSSREEMPARDAPALRNLYRTPGTYAHQIAMRYVPPFLAPVLLAFLFLILAAGCLSWPASGPVTQQTTAPPAPGSLDLSSSPDGSEIYLDRVYRGTTPSVIAELPPGSHALEFRLSGYTSWTTTIEITPGNRAYIYASLSPVTTLPTTVVTTIPITGPAGCWEYFDSDDSGYARLALQENGAGTVTEGFEKAESSMAITWSYDPHTTVVAFVEASPADPDHPWEMSMSYDEDEDVLQQVGSGGKLYHMDRVACQVP